ncbi:unnamed protein product [Caenorhabditis brenneri]
MSVRRRRFAGKHLSVIGHAGNLEAQDSVVTHNHPTPSQHTFSGSYGDYACGWIMPTWHDRKMNCFVASEYADLVEPCSTRLKPLHHRLTRLLYAESGTQTLVGCLKVCADWHTLGQSVCYEGRITMSLVYFTFSDILLLVTLPLMIGEFFRGRNYVNPIAHARQPRPRLRRLADNLRRDRHHDPVREEYILIDRTTLTEFFGWWETLNMDRVQRLVRSEDGWPTHMLNRSISANGGIRLHVWAANLPSPATHFEECRKRLPILNNAPRAQDFFLEHACAQPEMREGPATNRCPMCASHLFGFPMKDHTVQECPFSDLSTEERLEFMAINHFAWCSGCGSRSPNHVSPQCDDTWPVCGKCGQPGHHHVQGMCDGHPLGLPTWEAHDEVALRVEQYRLNFYRRVQHNLRHAPLEHRLKYRLHLDHTFHQTFRRRARYQPVNGWGPYQDPNGVFADAPLSLYANHGRPGVKAQYNELVVPEFDTRHVAKLPEFREDEHNYLEQIATLVSRIRDNAPPETLQLPDDPPQTLRPAVQPAPVPPQRPLRQVAEDRPRTPARQLRVPAPRLFEPAPSAHRSQSLAQHKGTTAKAEVSYLEAPQGLQGRSWADIENEERERVHNATQASRQSQSQPNVRTSPLRYVRAQNPHDVATSSNVVVQQASVSSSSPEKEEYATRNGSRQSGRSSRRDQCDPYDSEDTQNTRRAFSPLRLIVDYGQQKAENALINRALALCQAPMPVDNAPARTLFQSVPFELVSGEIPDDRTALIGRIRAIQIILTGQCEMQPGELESSEDHKLVGYAYSLQAIGRALQRTPILIVQLETSSAARILEKALNGSDVTRIPSMAVCGDPEVAAFMNDLKANQSPRTPSILNRFGDHHRWVPKSFFGPTHEDPGVTDDMILVEELNQLPKPTAGYAYAPPESRLEVAIELGRPIRDLEALQFRVKYFLWLLTGQEQVGITREAHGKNTLNEYLDLLVGVAKVALMGRRLHHVIRVSLCHCTRSLAMFANERHHLAFPSWGLYKTVEPGFWFAWMETVLASLMHTLTFERGEDRSTSCTSTDNSEVEDRKHHASDGAQRHLSKLTRQHASDGVIVISTSVRSTMLPMAHSAIALKLTEPNAHDDAQRHQRFSGSNMLLMMHDIINHERKTLKARMLLMTQSSAITHVLQATLFPAVHKQQSGSGRGPSKRMPGVGSQSDQLGVLQPAFCLISPLGVMFSTYCALGPEHTRDTATWFHSISGRMSPSRT